jgi:hypothetical protein
MVAIIDFNALIFVILLVANIILCIRTVPILGLVLGFLTMVLTGMVFMNSVIIDLYFSYVLLVIGFSCMIINGLDFRRKK